MNIARLQEIAGRTYPARRRTQNLVGGASPIQATSFAMGYVTLEPKGGQVPWHNQEQEEIYFVVQGTGQMCLGEECRELKTGEAVYIPSGVFHQLTNVGDEPLTARCRRPVSRRPPCPAMPGRSAPTSRSIARRRRSRRGPDVTHLSLHDSWQSNTRSTGSASR